MVRPDGALARPDGALWHGPMLLYGTARWCFMARPAGVVWYGPMVLYGTVRWCFMARPESWRVSREIFCFSNVVKYEGVKQKPPQCDKN
jgi:hypothetical protein